MTHSEQPSRPCHQTSYTEPTNRRVLILECAQSTYRVREYLEKAYFRVRVGTFEIAQIRRFDPSLIIVDRGQAVSKAHELCRLIRSTAFLLTVPVMVIAEGVPEEEKILGLEVGADDYISRIPSQREFMARVNALLRRYARSTAAGQRLQVHIGNPASSFRTGDLEIDTMAMRVRICGDEITVTSLEFRLIYCLALNQRRVLTRDQLLDAVWEVQFLEPRSVDACVRRLRNKIERDPANPVYLKTIRGVGYSFDMSLQSRGIVAEGVRGEQDRIEQASYSAPGSIEQFESA